eukprot:gene35235-47357_t
MGGHPGGHLFSLGGGVVQAQLAAAPEHVVAGGRPLFGLQVAQLGFKQARGHLGAQVLQPGGRADDPVDAAAIGPCQAVYQGGR